MGGEGVAITGFVNHELAPIPIVANPHFHNTDLWRASVTLPEYGLLHTEYSVRSMQLNIGSGTSWLVGSGNTGYSGPVPILRTSLSEP